MLETLPGPAGRAHKHLQELMGLLDQALPGDSLRDLKATLQERGTSACVFARLGTEEQMEQDLRAMRDAAAGAGSDDDELTGIANVRRLIDASLAELRGH